MANRRRPIPKRIWFTEEEWHLVEAKMVEAKMTNFSAFGLEMLLHGEVRHSQITKYEKKYHSPLIFLELYPKPITLKCTPELYAKCMGEEHQHDIQENEHDER